MKIRCPNPKCNIKFEAEPEQKECPYCGTSLSSAKKPALVAKQEEQERKRAKGCLTILISAFILIIFVALVSNKDDSSKTSTPALIPTPVKTKEEIEAEKQKIQLEAEKALDGYMDFINTSEMNEYVSEVEISGSIGEDIKVTVRNNWHYSPKQIRLQAAQTLWETWATLYCLEKETIDLCRITLVDLNGNIVGGSSAWAGSIINVID